MTQQLSDAQRRKIQAIMNESPPEPTIPDYSDIDDLYIDDETINEPIIKRPARPPLERPPRIPESNNDYETGSVKKAVVHQASAMPNAKVMAGGGGSVVGGGLIMAFVILFELDKSLTALQITALTTIASSVTGFVAAYMKPITAKINK